MNCENCLNLDCSPSGTYCMVVDCGCSIMLPKVACPNFEPRENCKTVEWVLKSLNYNEYCHILVRRKGKYFGDSQTLGGGSAYNVIKRFGSEIVLTTEVVHNSLIIYIV